LTRARGQADPEQVSWKKLQGDVFRAPSYPIFLCISVGMGCQVFSMFFIILTSIVMGIVHPYVRYVFAVQSFFFLSLGGAVNGYVSARLMRYFGA